MGLAASQARYIFITQRKISLEGALMANSNKQIRLAQEAAELSEEKNDALNEKEWKFNGESGFSYDMMMGDSALDSENGLYLLMTSGDKQQVVLNTKYASAMMAAGVPQSGGNYSAAALANFMNVVAGAPQEASSWEDVINNPQKQARSEAIKSDSANKSRAAEFIATYGMPNAEKTTHAETFTSSVTSVSDLLRKMGNLGSIGTLSTRDVNRRSYTFSLLLKGDKTAGTINDSNRSYYDTVFGADNTDDVIVMLQHSASFSTLEAQDKAQSRFKEIANSIIDKIASALGEDSNVLRNNLSGYVNSLENALSNTSAMRDADRDGDDWAQMALFGGDQCGTYLNLSELIRLLVGHACGISVSEKYAAKDDSEWDKRIAGNGSHLNSDNRLGFKSNATFKYESQHAVTDYEADAETGYKFPDWLNKYNSLPDTVKYYVYNSLTEELKGAVTNKGVQPDIPSVSLYSKDNAVMEKYEQIYKEALNGWTYDKDVNNKNYLTNKLTNNQYLIKHNDKTTNMKNSGAFELVKKYDKDEVDAYYDAKNDEFKVKDKKLQAEQNRIQAELSAVNTEQESIKTIIQNNIQKGFTYGYDA